MRFVAVLLLAFLATHRCGDIILPDWHINRGSKIGRIMQNCQDAWERGDHDAAFKPCNKAAKLGGVASAEYRVGFMYDNGDGVPEDDVLAFMWLNLATAQGYYEKNDEHRIRFEKAEHAIDILRKELTPEQIAEAERMATKWSKKHEKFRR